jgi:hypothetical protein
MNLPTPEQERKAVIAFTAFAVLSLLGAGALLFAIATVLVKAAQWVWSF